MPASSSSARTSAALGLVAAVLFWAAAAVRFAKSGHFTPETGYLLAMGGFWALITRRKTPGRGAGAGDGAPPASDR